MAGRRRLEDLSESELLNRKSGIEENLRTSFQNLSKFVYDSKGHFFTNDHSRVFGRLEGYYNKYMNKATELNPYLHVYERIDISRYTEKHEVLMDKIDEKNSGYIIEECDKIIRERRERREIREMKERRRREMREMKERRRREMRRRERGLEENKGIKRSEKSDESEVGENGESEEEGGYIPYTIPEVKDPKRNYRYNF